MKIVKKVAKLLAIGLLLYSFVRPMSIPKLPPVERLATITILK